eukprot:5011766-Amphidinium_carterae.1
MKQTLALLGNINMLMQVMWRTKEHMCFSDTPFIVEEGWDSCLCGILLEWFKFRLQSLQRQHV